MTGNRFLLQHHELAGPNSLRWPLPPLRPKRAAYGVAGLRSGSGQEDARHALIKPLASKPRPKLFHLTYILSMFGDDEGDVVVLLMRAETADFIHNRSERSL